MIIFGLKVMRSEEQKIQVLNERMNEWTYQFSDQQADTALIIYWKKYHIIIGIEWGNRYNSRSRRKKEKVLLKIEYWQHLSWSNKQYDLKRYI